MSIYANRDSNIRKTYILFAGFFIFIIGLGWVFSNAYGDSTILYIAVIFSTIMSIASYWFSDKLVLSLSGAEPIAKNDNPELYRVVENLAITAGLPTPKIYIIPESAPNAFATGRDPAHSSIAVTEGLLKIMNKDELAGVIAHELSHVGNRDILIGTVAVVLVGFISLMADFFLRMNFMRSRRNNEEGGAQAYFMIFGLVLSILAPIAATLIRLAISRRRESLADVSGSLLTRYPEGLANALQKIADDETPMMHANNTTAHLWLSDPFKNKTNASFLNRMFMTHPPIEERIRALREMDIS